ncbi:MAG TPA: hypothetical protein VH309_11445, partial [Elusimicrobiota bacterium]|nr:hypothetical protein [Elusimicrobiota bacterium]
ATLTAATASLTADFNASGYTMVGFEVFVTGSSGATLFRMTLNGDSAAHYAYVYSVNGGATTTGVSQAYIDLTGTTYTGGGYCTIKGSAALGQASDFVAACRRFGAITLAPQTDESGGTYNGTTALTSVTFAASAGTLSAGTTIRVFGAQ